MRVSGSVKCALPRGIGKRTQGNRETKAKYKCIADPSGDFLGGIFNIIDIYASRPHWDIGTTFQNVKTGSRMKVVKTSRPRKGGNNKVFQNIGKG